MAVGQTPGLALRDRSPPDAYALSLHNVYELGVSPRVLAELEDVLRRPKFDHYATDNDVDELLDALREDVVYADDPLVIEPVSVDPRDDYLVALARESGAFALVSGDRHLLELDTRPPVLTPRELLGLIQPS